jgi:NAD(P)-dependent dehydrogenase (short-subunit alcohol dehydrogenase family)
MSNLLESQAWFEGTTLGFLQRQFTRPKTIPSSVRLTGQVAIVTGSNVGLGLEASRQLLQLGLYHLVMGVRSKAKGESAADGLRKEFPAAIISVWIVDMESYESVMEFSRQCAALPRLDIAILNAGLAKAPYTVVPATGHEVTFQVNYLSTALLAILLLPTLKEARNIRGPAGPAVLSIVGSDLAYQIQIDMTGPVLQQFDSPKGFSKLDRYAKTKLLLVLFLSKLSDMVNPDDVIVNMSNPGMTRGTDFFRDLSWIILKFVGLAQLLIARRVDVAASTYIDAVVSYGREGHGSFISDWAIKP